MLIKPRLAVAVCAALLLGLAAPAGALAGDLDQQQVNSNGLVAVASAQTLAQTFTAGRTGLLDQVDLLMKVTGSPPPLTVELRNVSAGDPGTQVLASASVPAANVPTSAAFFPIAFPYPAPVAAGSQYAIVAYATNSVGNFYQWGDQGLNPYAGGVELVSHATPPNTTWTANTGFDTAFKTYVAPPTTVASPTGQRAAALKKCKNKKTAKARKKCRKRANRLPV